MFKSQIIRFISLLFLSGGSIAFGQWAPVKSGTTNNLGAIHLLDSGTA